MTCWALAHLGYHACQALALAGVESQAEEGAAAAGGVGDHMDLAQGLASAGAAAWAAVHRLLAVLLSHIGGMMAHELSARQTCDFRYRSRDGLTRSPRGRSSMGAGGWLGWKPPGGGPSTSGC
jgi:hypothetical protein